MPTKLLPLKMKKPMPWQAQLFIGQRVHDAHEAREIFQKLGCHTLEYLNDEELEEELWNDPKFDRYAFHKGENIEVEIRFRRECEGGCPWPVPRTDDYSDAIIGFALTSRYAPAILDKGHSHGRSEPFEFEPHDICEILDKVREWWPEAKAIIWDVWY